MRTRVIPAQITTVEDKIAGNLSFTQICLLMLPVFWTTMVYTIFPQKMALTPYKIPLILGAVIISLTLSLRIKGKVVLQWLMVLVNYNLRPKYYIFNKNEDYLKDMDIPIPDKKPKKVFKFSFAFHKKKLNTPALADRESHLLEKLVAQHKLRPTFKTNKKGGFDVAFEQVQK